MDDFEPAKKQCGNCKYFVRHYVNKDGTFSSMPVGHCVCNKFTSRKKLRVSVFDICEFWEDGSDKIQQRNKSIEDALYKMADNLDHFIQIIKDEKSQK